MSDLNTLRSPLFNTRKEKLVFMDKWQQKILPYLPWTGEFILSDEIRNSKITDSDKYRLLELEGDFLIKQTLFSLSYAKQESGNYISLTNIGKQVRQIAIYNSILQFAVETAIHPYQNFTQKEVMEALQLSDDEYSSATQKMNIEKYILKTDMEFSMQDKGIAFWKSGGYPYGSNQSGLVVSAGERATNIHNGNVINTGIYSTGDYSSINLNKSQVIGNINNEGTLNDEIKDDIKKLIKTIQDSIEIFGDSQDEVKSELNRIEIQTKKEKPKINILKNSFEMLKSIFIEVVATGTAPLILEGINKIGHTLSNLLH